MRTFIYCVRLTKSLHCGTRACACVVIRVRGQNKIRAISVSRLHARRIRRNVVVRGVIGNLAEREFYYAYLKRTAIRKFHVKQNRVNGETKWTLRFRLQTTISEF